MNEMEDIVIDPRELRRELADVKAKLRDHMEEIHVLSPEEHQKLLHRQCNILYDLNPSTAAPSKKGSTARARVKRPAIKAPAAGIELSLDDL